MDTELLIYYIWELCTSMEDCVDDGFISPEVTTALTSLSDGEIGNNDLETILLDVQDSLMYTTTDTENVTALSEISQRLEVIDTRLDSEFIALNDCFGFISTLLLCFVSFKFLNWLVRSFGV